MLRQTQGGIGVERSSSRALADHSGETASAEETLPPLLPSLIDCTTEVRLAGSGGLRKNNSESFRAVCTAWRTSRGRNRITIVHDEDFREDSQGQPLWSQCPARWHCTYLPFSPFLSFSFSFCPCLFLSPCLPLAKLKIKFDLIAAQMACLFVVSNGLCLGCFSCVGIVCDALPLSSSSWKSPHLVHRRECTPSLVTKPALVFLLATTILYYQSLGSWNTCHRPHAPVLLYIQILTAEGIIAWRIQSNLLARVCRPLSVALGRCLRWTLMPDL